MQKRSEKPKKELSFLYTQKLEARKACERGYFLVSGFLLYTMNNLMLAFPMSFVVQTYPSLIIDKAYALTLDVMAFGCYEAK